MSVAGRSREQDNFMVTLTDLLVGVLFLFIILMMTFALQFSVKRDALTRLSLTRLQIREQLLERLQTRLGKATGNVVEIDRIAGTLRFRANLLFEPNDDALKEPGKRALQELALALRDEMPCLSGDATAVHCPPGRPPIIEAVYVEGHTDPDPPRAGTKFEDNEQLSTARSIAAFRELDTITGDSALRNANGQTLLGVSAYGATRQLPGASKSDNRRVEFRFMLAPPTRAEMDAATGTGR